MNTILWTKILYDFVFYCGTVNLIIVCFKKCGSLYFVHLWWCLWLFQTVLHTHVVHCILFISGDVFGCFRLSSTPMWFIVSCSSLVMSLVVSDCPPHPCGSLYLVHLWWCLWLFQTVLHTHVVHCILFISGDVFGCFRLSSTPMWFIVSCSSLVMSLVVSDCPPHPCGSLYLVHLWWCLWLFQTVLHTHAVHRISFISRDVSDNRAFGYIYGPGDGTHKFFGIKTEKAVCWWYIITVFDCNINVY